MRGRKVYKERGKLFMVNPKITASIVVLIGIVLIIVGIILPMPGTVLTTTEYLEGEKTVDGQKTFNVIDEYLGGDISESFIIGASLVGGEISGRMAQKAIVSVAGVLIIVTGIILLSKAFYIPHMKNINTSIDISNTSSSITPMTSGTSEEPVESENIQS